MGDIFTDPQIHTLDGRGFGDGNLGLRGFALFFRTHSCNALCKSMGACMEQHKPGPCS